MPGPVPCALIVFLYEVAHPQCIADCAHTYGGSNEGRGRGGTWWRTCCCWPTKKTWHRFTLDVGSHLPPSFLIARVRVCMQDSMHAGCKRMKGKLRPSRATNHPIAVHQTVWHIQTGDIIHHAQYTRLHIWRHLYQSLSLRQSKTSGSNFEPILDYLRACGP